MERGQIQRSTREVSEAFRLGTTSVQFCRPKLLDSRSRDAPSTYHYTDTGNTKMHRIAANDFSMNIIAKGLKKIPNISHSN